MLQRSYVGTSIKKGISFQWWFNCCRSGFLRQNFYVFSSIWFCRSQAKLQLERTIQPVYIDMKSGSLEAFILILILSLMGAVMKFMFSVLSWGTGIHQLLMVKNQLPDQGKEFFVFVVFKSDPSYTGVIINLIFFLCWHYYFITTILFFFIDICGKH